MHRTFIILAMSYQVFSEPAKNPKIEPAKKESEIKAEFVQVESNQASQLEADSKKTPAHTGDFLREYSKVSRSLSSGDTEGDIAHYKIQTRRIGIDAGVIVPGGDFAKEFGSAPGIGIHFMWEAIRPLNLMVSSHFSSAQRTTGVQQGRLTVASLGMGANALFEMGRAIPYFRLEACFDFNNVSMGATYVTSGGDGFITTLGANIGLGVDFIVGREVSFGLQLFYHYGVPKKVTLSDTTAFDLGSGYTFAGLRINF